MRELVRSSVHVFLNPAVAAAAAALIVVVVAALAAPRVLLTPGDAAHAYVEHVSVKSVAVQPPAAAAPAVQGSGASASADVPLIARTAKVSLYVSNVDKAAAAIARAARSNAGEVFSSDVTAGDGTQQPSGSVEIRVPADRYERAMSAVTSAGRVRERSSNAEDLTGSITDSDARLRNLRRTEADIRRIMDRSGTVTQIMDAEDRLSQIREQIETLESELKDMRTRVAYATIDVDIQAEAMQAPVAPAASSQLASAWQGAVASLSAFTIGLAATALWLLVFVPYWLAAFGAFWLGLRYVRKRAEVSNSSA